MRASEGTDDPRGPSSLNRVNPVFGPGGEPIASRLTGEGEGSYFAKPSLDDMGPGTDTPTPNRTLFRKNSLDEMTVGRTEKPKGGTTPQKPTPAADPKASTDDARPIRRERIGIGSYEDAGDEKRRKRRPGKTGRPGR